MPEKYNFFPLNSYIDRGGGLTKNEPCHGGTPILVELVSKFHSPSPSTSLGCQKTKHGLVGHPLGYYFFEDEKAQGLVMYNVSQVAPLHLLSLRKFCKMHNIVPYDLYVM